VDAWAQIEAWLAENAPDVAKSLLPGAKDADFDAVEKTTGVRLDRAARNALARHNGQDSFGPPLVGDWLLLGTSEMLRQREFTLAATAGSNADSTVEPDDGIAKRWFDERWLPMAHDGAGNFLCLDHNPAKGGREGQVISMSSAGPGRRLVAKDMDEWLRGLASDMGAGRCAWRDGQVQCDGR
jgi:cell wall assembly regulator SMI1